MTRKNAPERQIRRLSHEELADLVLSGRETPPFSRGVQRSELLRRLGSKQGPPEKVVHFGLDGVAVLRMVINGEVQG